jgi:hypothetical protein
MFSHCHLSSHQWKEYVLALASPLMGIKINKEDYNAILMVKKVKSL